MKTQISGKEIVGVEYDGNSRNDLKRKRNVKDGFNQKQTKSDGKHNRGRL